jgi:hypothetical protein
VQLALDVPDPEIEKLAQLGKVRGQIVVLPQEGLQQRRVIRQMIGDLGGCQAIAAEL